MSEGSEGDDVARSESGTTGATDATDARTELLSITASLRAYLEWQTDSGAYGIPKADRSVAGRPSVSQATPGPDLGPGAHVVPPRKESAAQPPPPTSVPSGQAAPAVPSNDTSRVALTLAPSLPVDNAPQQSGNRPDDERGALPTEPRSLPVLRELVASCHACRLSETRTNTVFSRGNPQASIVFVGEAPGADEDAQGLPFVGRAGQLLDKMIAAMGLDPERDVYVCNIVKCRPPANRKPEPDELAACFPYLDEQLANVKPKVMVAMGTTAVLALFDTKMGITRVRGQWKLYKGRVPTMPTYHPSYLLRPSPQQVEAKRQCWEDLQAVMKELGLARKPKG